jgi:YVTN family beta-propeller protein
LRRVETQRALAFFSLRRFVLPAIGLIGLLLLTFLKTIDHLDSSPVVAKSTQFSTFLPAILNGDAFAPINFSSRQTSGLIDYDPSTDQVWVVNPDSGSVSVIDAQKNRLITEIWVGGEPWSLAIAPAEQTVYVTDKAGGVFIEIDAVSFEVENRLLVGAEPAAVLLHPSQNTAYITLQTAAQVAVIDLVQFKAIKKITTAPFPTDMALIDNQLLVAHLLAQPSRDGEEARDDGKEGAVTVIDLENDAVHPYILEANAHGFPNLLGSFAVYNNQAWIPHVRAAPDLPNNLTSIIFAAVSLLDLDAQAENSSAFLPLNDQEVFGSPINNPVAAVASNDGNTLFVVSAGSDLIEAIDVSEPTQPKLIRFLPTGINPRGMVLSANGSRGYVMNYLSRSVSVLDLENFSPISEIKVTDESLSAEHLQGKILFNTAKIPKMSNASWISCASCHPNGGVDGVTWMFPDGPRQTPPIWNAAQTLPWHWSAALDEMQDVEDTIQTIQHGIGLAAGGESAPLMVQHGGRSSELDALAVFMAIGIRPLQIPTSAADFNDIEMGRQTFKQMGCATCHGGPTWTTSSLSGIPYPPDPDQNGMIDELLHDVGTLNRRDVKGATGFDVPSLLNVGITAPYFHDGSIHTLEALVQSGHPSPQNGQLLEPLSLEPLSENELQNLVDFLISIGPNSLPVATAPQENNHEE